MPQGKESKGTISADGSCRATKARGETKQRLPANKSVTVLAQLKWNNLICDSTENEHADFLRIYLIPKQDIADSIIVLLK